MQLRSLSSCSSVWLAVVTAVEADVTINSRCDLIKLFYYYFTFLFPVGFVVSFLICFACRWLGEIRVVGRALF